MADEQQTNGEMNGQGASNSGADPVVGAGFGAADGGFPVSGNGAVLPAKKPKTEAQKARERERRKRRRRNKLRVRPGEDVPLVLSSKAGVAGGPPPARNVPLKPEVESEVEEVVDTKIPWRPAGGEALVDDIPVSIAPVEPLNSREEPVDGVAMPVDSVNDNEVSDKLIDSNPQIDAAGDSYPAPSQVDQPTIQHQFVDSEPDQASNSYWPTQPVEPAWPQVEHSEDDLDPLMPPPAPPVPPTMPSVPPMPIVQEEVSPQADQIASMESMAQPVEPWHEETLTDQEPPIQQSTVVEDSPVEVIDHDDQEARMEEELQRRRQHEALALMDDLHGAEQGDLLEEVPQGRWIMANIMRTVGAIVLVVILAVAAFWAGSSLHLLDRLGGLFVGQKGPELVVGDNSKVVQDQYMLSKWGYQTALIMGANRGDVRDMAYNVFFNADYFGKLKEPMSVMETGISAALYYGFGHDDEYFKNRFIYYIHSLQAVREANQVNVNGVMNGKLRRDNALDEYLAQIKEIFKVSNDLRREINLQVDDLKVAVNSLTANKDRYEVDFFAALDKLEAEKADMLIEKFVQITREQLGWKARLAALTRLSELYEKDLIDLKLRIEAIEKNREALVEGVLFTEIPGSGIDLIRKP